jgi:hypothetical protein
VVGLIAAVVAAAGCSGGSSAATSSAPPATTPVGSQPPASQTPPQPPPAAHAALAVARRYLTSLAEGQDARAGSLAAPAGGDAAGRLAVLDGWLDAVPIARAAGDASAAARPSSAAAGDRAVAVALRARLTGTPPSAWVPLGTRVLLLAPEAARWRVADDVTDDPAVAEQPTGLAVLGRPHVLHGAHATVVYGPAVARRQAVEVRRLADAAAPDLHGTYGGGPAAARPLIFVVDDAAQAERLIGRDVGQVLPAGSVAGPFAYVFLRQYRRIDPISRGAVVTALMTHLATELALRHAPTSLRAGVDAYEQNRYLNSRGYVLPLDRIAAAYPGYPTLARWTSRQPLWGLNGRAQQLAGQDALAMVHVILTRHGGAPALRRLGKAFAHTGSDITAADVRRAFRSALDVSFASVVGEAHAYAQGGSWKFS